MSMKPKRRYIAAVILSHVLITIIVTIVAHCVDSFSNWGSSNAHQENEISHGKLLYGRRLLQANNTNEPCIPRSIEEFPPDFLTLEDKQNGAIIFHIFVAFYLFAALAIVCDRYFVESIEKICEVTHMKSDVAGATLMAAGSSAPELFTSLIGVFITKSDVGISTIVGSAVFNILCIVALCALFAGAIIELNWWPLLRDTLFYCISVVALIIIIIDSHVWWYESLVFLLLYILYIVIMYFNEKLRLVVTNFLPGNKLNTEIGFGEIMGNRKAKTENSPLFGASDDEQNSLLLSGRNTDDEETAARLEESVNEKEEEFESTFEIPKSFLGRIYYVAMFPVTCLMFITTPDCTRPGFWGKLFPITFIMSIIWIGGFSYILVWMVCSVGDAWGIPDTIMGLTLLAAGTSIPDALAGVIVAREGLGDMAISNSVGSNVFDILVGLGIPWFLQTAIITPGKTIYINSSGNTFASISLLGTVVFLIAVVALNRWRLTMKLGVIFFCAYFVFIVFSCMYELNVFGVVNPPACHRKRW